MHVDIWSLPRLAAPKRAVPRIFSGPAHAVDKILFCGCPSAPLPLIPNVGTVGATERPPTHSHSEVSSILRCSAIASALLRNSVAARTRSARVETSPAIYGTATLTAPLRRRKRCGIDEVSAGRVLVAGGAPS